MQGRERGTGGANGVSRPTDRRRPSEARSEQSGDPNPWPTGDPRERARRPNDTLWEPLSKRVWAPLALGAALGCCIALLLFRVTESQEPLHGGDEVPGLSGRGGWVVGERASLLSQMKGGAWPAGWAFFGRSFPGWKVHASLADGDVEVLSASLVHHPPPLPPCGSLPHPLSPFPSLPLSLCILLHC